MSPEPADKENNLSPLPIPALPVVMIGSGTGDGGAPITTGTVGATPDHQPNIIIRVISPLFAIVVRFINDFCVSLVGSLTAGGLMTKILPFMDFHDLLIGAITLAASIAGVGALKNVATIASGLEKKFPLINA